MNNPLRLRNPINRYALPAILVIAVLAASAHAQQVSPYEVRQQNKHYQTYWGTNLTWKFDRLPAKASVPGFRLPYAGAIYPDNQGGTEKVLWKYDRAFHPGRNSTVGFERYDIVRHMETKRGFLGASRSTTPYWAGHCNGWTAAAIRHAQPKKSVVRNGVVFTPADIKGLLAEMYTFCDVETLAGDHSVVNPATLHVILANWIGRGQHSIGMDATVGKEVWNYPVYAYASDFRRRGSRQVEVELNLGYVNFIEPEPQVAPKNCKFKYFHYDLFLNSDGEIVGGSYYGDSERIDMLWVPLKPAQGGKKGNLRGNPYLNVDSVLDMWRESAPEEIRAKWHNIDPIKEDVTLVQRHMDQQQQTPTSKLTSEQTKESTPTDEKADEAEATPAETSISNATERQETEEVREISRQEAYQELLRAARQRSQ